jgi:urease alpha subunit
MSEIDDYKKLVALAEKQRDEKSRLKGSLDTIIQNIKEMGYSSIGKANIDLKNNRILLQKKQAEREKKMESFREKYEEFLQG